jgi:peroxiredoxin
LEALAAAHREIACLGATLIALSPQAPAKLSPPGNSGGRPFPVLQDRGCEIAARYRIAFTVPQQYRAAYLGLGYAHPAKNGSKAWVLPIPATYLIDSAGLVVLSYLDADHTTRLEPTELIVALTHLRAASIPDGNNR